MLPEVIECAKVFRVCVAFIKWRTTRNCSSVIDGFTTMSGLVQVCK